VKKHLVLLHGSPGNARSWKAFAALAPTGMPVHAWDLLDHGDEDAPDATVDDMVADIVARTRALDGSVTLVGHSFGAWVGGRALLELGDQVTHFVAVAGLAAIPADIAERSLGFAAALESGQLSLAVAAGMACDIWLPAVGREALHVRPRLECE
jgi:pimeloyl-ACP methyl ester carboxylesterase